MRVRIRALVTFGNAFGGDCVIGNGVVMDDQQQQPALVWAPTENTVLSQSPVRVQTPVQVDQISALLKIQALVEADENRRRNRVQQIRICKKNRVRWICHDITLECPAADGVCQRLPSMNPGPLLYVSAAPGIS